MQEEDAEEVDNFGQGGFNRARKFIWELFEEPNKSKLGKVVIFFFFFGLDMMACQLPSLLARTQLMPVELYSHQLHLIKPTAGAHFVLVHISCSCTFVLVHIRARAHFVLVHTNAQCRALMYRTVDVQQSPKQLSEQSSKAINCLSTAYT